jgi:phage-related protein
MVIHYYKRAGGKNVIQEYIDSLPGNEKADILFTLDKLKREGMDYLDSLNTRQIKGKLYEIKLSDDRLFYILIDQDNIHILHACRKQKDKTEDKDKETALQRMKNVFK